MDHATRVIANAADCGCRAGSYTCAAHQHQPQPQTNTAYTPNRAERRKRGHRGPLVPHAVAAAVGDRYGVPPSTVGSMVAIQTREDALDA